MDAISPTQEFFSVKDFKNKHGKATTDTVFGEYGIVYQDYFEEYIQKKKKKKQKKDNDNSDDGGNRNGPSIESIELTSVDGKRDNENNDESA